MKKMIAGIIMFIYILLLSGCPKQAYVINDTVTNDNRIIKQQTDIETNNPNNTNLERKLEQNLINMKFITGNGK